eukprot:scaffold3343_cov120-Isochrysis_galbana.AAC.3
MRHTLVSPCQRAVLSARSSINPAPDTRSTLPRRSACSASLQARDLRPLQHGLSEPAQTRRHPGPHNARAAPLCRPVSSTQPIGWLMRALGDLHTASSRHMWLWRPLPADAVDGDAPLFFLFLLLLLQ